MATMLTIGDFSRMTHLSVKALLALPRPGRARARRRRPVHRLPVVRHQPGGVGAGHQAAAGPRHAPGLDRGRSSPPPTSRPGTARSRLTWRGMERQLEQTQASVAALRALLNGPGRPAAIELRAIPAVTALAVRQMVDAAELTEWGSRRVRGARAGADRRRADRSLPVRRSVPGRLLRARAERDNGLPPGHVRRRSGRGQPGPGRARSAAGDPRRRGGGRGPPGRVQRDRPDLRRGRRGGGRARHRRRRPHPRVLPGQFGRHRRRGQAQDRGLLAGLPHRRGFGERSL